MRCAWIEACRCSVHQMWCFPKRGLNPVAQLHIRNQTLSFDEVFASLKKFRDGGKDISRISVYCDQLDCTSNATGDEKDGRLAVYTVGFELTHLFIYARSFLTFSPIDSLRLADSFGLTISLYYDICNPTVVLQLCGDQRLGVCWQSDIMMVLEDQGRWRPEILQQDGEARLQATGVLGLKAYEARCQSAGREIRCRGPTTPPIVRLLRNVPPLELDAGSSPQRLSLPSPGCVTQIKLCSIVTDVEQEPAHHSANDSRSGSKADNRKF